MSNSIYGNIIEDYLPYNYINNSNICRKELYKLQINYVKESKLKDDMLICGKELEQGFIMIGSVEGCRTFECQGKFRFQQAVLIFYQVQFSIWLLAVYKLQSI